MIDAVAMGEREAVTAEDPALRARFVALAGELGPAMDRLAGGYERDADRRRDLAQEIWVALWRALPGFEGRSSLRTWVYRVAHNVATTHCIRARRSQREAWVSIEE